MVGVDHSDGAKAALDFAHEEARLRDVVEGIPGAVLVDLSRDAELIVVGSRGHRGFAQLLLGSVSQKFAHHAECFVVIVQSKVQAK